MKNIIDRKTLRYLFTILTLAVFLSCSKDDDSPEAPKFTKLTPLKELDKPITSGNMGDWIAIQGENLKTVKSILFNDVLVDTKQVYYENNILYLQIPVQMPSQVSNKVKLTTGSGTAEFDFAVNIPDLKLTEIFNEYTRPGDTLKIYGDFFKLYEVDSLNTVVSFDGTEQPVIKCGVNFITTKVPANVSPNIKLTVINKKYNVSVQCPGYYQDRQFVITNFDDIPYSGSDGVQYIGSWTNPKPISGNYTNLTVGTEGSGWSYLMGTGCAYTGDMKDHPEKYQIKFELNMVLPIIKTKFYIYNYWNHPPAEITAADLVVQNVGTWQTIRIPLEKLIPLNFDGNKDNIGSFNIRIESPAGESVSMGWDNFRIALKD